MADQDFYAPFNPLYSGIGNLVVVALCILLSLRAPAIAGGPSDVVPKPLTTDWVLREIAEHGPRHAVRVMWDQERYDEFLGNISAGKQEWIALAPELAAGTDAGASEGFGISLADALPKSPKAVLGVLDPSKWTISSARVCSIPFIEPEKAFYESYARAALVAVEAVSDAGLARQKELCRAELQKAMTRRGDFR